ncbi:MAG: hypothetical protein VB088_14380, partial [Sphaerochaeta sp.]|nr:hypothetical protein [Sphaerochaeta sp.]
GDQMLKHPVVHTIGKQGILTEPTAVNWIKNRRAAGRAPVLIELCEGKRSKLFLANRAKQRISEGIA